MLVIFIFQSCGERDESTALNTVTVSHSDTIKISKIDSGQKTSSTINNSVIGIWWDVKGDNPSASFEIQKDKMYYPELFKSYKYKVVNDSLKIKYDDYEGSFLVRMKGNATLILVGDEEQKYYRGKK